MDGKRAVALARERAQTLRDGTLRRLGKEKPSELALAEQALRDAFESESERTLRAALEVFEPLVERDELAADRLADLFVADGYTYIRGYREQNELSPGSPAPSTMARRRFKEALRWRPNHLPASSALRKWDADSRRQEEEIQERLTEDWSPRWASGQPLPSAAKPRGSDASHAADVQALVELYKDDLALWSEAFNCRATLKRRGLLPYAELLTAFDGETTRPLEALARSSTCSLILEGEVDELLGDVAVRNSLRAEHETPQTIIGVESAPNRTTARDYPPYPYPYALSGIGYACFGCGRLLEDQYQRGLCPLCLHRDEGWQPTDFDPEEHYANLDEDLNGGMPFSDLSNEDDT